MAEQQSMRTQAGTGSPEVDGIVAAIMAAQPQLPEDDVRAGVRAIRELVAELDAFPLANAEEPAAAFQIWREGE